MNEKPKCGTCIHWNFKVSVVKCWGQCLLADCRESMYISIKVPFDIKGSVEMANFRDRVENCCEVYFEENSFGCIYHHPQTEEP